MGYANNIQIDELGQRMYLQNLARENGVVGERHFKAIDFFCGGGGMTCGLRQAGIDVIAGVDFDPTVGPTYEHNNPGSVFIHYDIKRLRSKYFEKNFGVEKDDDSLILVGCSPCQYYSIINTDKKKSRSTKDLLKSFARFVEYYRPGFVLVENVPGIVTNKDTILPTFLKKLKSCGYTNCKYDIVDMCYYGVPQSRRRFSLIATRLEGVDLHLPQKDDKMAILRDFIGEEHGFPKIAAGHEDSTPFFHSCAGLSDICIERLKMTPHDGGSRDAWSNNERLQLQCYVGADDCFKDNYGRMSWNKPAPTITTRFTSISNGRFGHPEEDRAISIREGATLQTFPKDYEFITKNRATAAKIIGNAVPCEYARRLGLLIQNLDYAV